MEWHNRSARGDRPSELLLPRLENRLPKYILNVDEAEAVLAVPDVSTVEGQRVGRRGHLHIHQIAEKPALLHTTLVSGGSHTGSMNA